MYSDAFILANRCLTLQNVDHERIALVTGAGSGIGRAVSLALQRAGYAVVLAGRRGVELERTAAMGVADGPRLLALPCDVTAPAEVRSLFEKTESEFGRLDVLFNNAGRGAAAVRWKN